MRSTAVSAFLALVAVQQAAANVRTSDQENQKTFTDVSYLGGS